MSRQQQCCVYRCVQVYGTTNKELNWNEEKPDRQDIYFLVCVFRVCLTSMCVNVKNCQTAAAIWRVKATGLYFFVCITCLFCSFVEYFNLICKFWHYVVFISEKQATTLNNKPLLWNQFQPKSLEDHVQSYQATGRNWIRFVLGGINCKAPARIPTVL